MSWLCLHIFVVNTVKKACKFWTALEWSFHLVLKQWHDPGADIKQTGI